MGFQKTKTFLTGVLGHYAMLHRQRDNVLTAAEDVIKEYETSDLVSMDPKAIKRLEKEVKKLRALEGE